MTIEAKTKETANPRIRLGMVGGGAGAFIGGVHRMAARLDNRFELVAGALSSSPEKAQASGRELGLAEDRIYSSYKEMAIREARLKNGIEAVAIVTPNHVHYDAAKEFLRRGIHVICDKPLTSTLADAKKLKKVADESGALFVLTHNYTGYPMVRQAREMIANGELGDLRVVQVEYAQDWLTEAVEKTGAKGAVWRTDPAQSGLGGATGDIGTHAFNLASFVTGLTLDSLAADLDSFVPGRRLDDNAHVMLRFAGGAKGMLWCSQVAPGNENALRLRVYGTKGGIEWAQEDPNRLWFTPFGEQKRLITRGGSGVGDAATRVTRVPGGHPEGYLEAFATIYVEAANAIQAKRDNTKPDSAVMYPTVDDGVKGVAFIDACVRSSNKNGGWVSL
ncbi:gfo/Idh/MocA family oxidoreductase [Ochrobactrum sp. MYb15]|uniref:Gfo/Idh/MocA family protein n=1 Tax=Brucella TaxID=234 RepID=UPI000467B4F2|nr:Gfo/Idh/MocA family oxidoreductase [Brucella rhizosphaerae]PQZ48366.1 gfo/Idh/MocA family oxidoreductase [Ochrobactrum sp. MYb19]PRA64550.1 gfo/Idh/MocA family oxidoreductase [Ochrobactrum sp. MYb18]PRA74938.1 gfo/Idh/MocA family oxidoreductase [Brucella thiophenivorans]PRA89849.1 gfo/Idh/MocA family oxidoreductase [Ochrobactrum sp. MYb14]PRA96881.1 gfo/Idh/MocA family oxidoreductase [Ochrobactrum sp. MYb15]